MFPVVAFAKDRTKEFCLNARELTRCSPAALSHGYYEGLKCVAANGVRFTAKSARKIGTIKHWWSPPVFFTLISVQLDVEDAGIVAVEELKQAFRRVFSYDPYILPSLGSSMKELDGALALCNSHQDVAEWLSKLKPIGPRI